MGWLPKGALQQSDSEGACPSPNPCSLPWLRFSLTLTMTTELFAPVGVVCSRWCSLLKRFRAPLCGNEALCCGCHRGCILTCAPRSWVFVRDQKCKVPPCMLPAGSTSCRQSRARLSSPQQGAAWARSMTPSGRRCWALALLTEMALGIPNV